MITPPDYNMFICSIVIGKYLSIKNYKNFSVKYFYNLYLIKLLVYFYFFRYRQH